MLDEGLRSGLFLSGLRRTGKTTFVRMDLIPALEKAGALVIYVDLWTDTSVNPAILTHAAIRRALADLQLPKSAALKNFKRVKGVDVGAAGFRFGFTLESVGAEGGTTLADALTSVVDQAKIDLVFIIDEVQQVITTDDGNNMLLAMKAARDAINQRPVSPKRFLFVGTGSHRALVSELTGRRNQAFAGAVSRAYPLLGTDYVQYDLARAIDDGITVTPSAEAANTGFMDLGNRPEELRKALRQLAASKLVGSDPDATFAVIVQTLRSAPADLELRTLESLGTLADAIFARIASSENGSKGMFSAAAAAEYTKAVRRDVRIEEIQPVVDRLLAANLVMRTGHGMYVVTDPFVREMWTEQQRALPGGTHPSARKQNAGRMSRKKPVSLPTPQRSPKKRS